MAKRRGRPWQYARFMIHLDNETLYSVFDIRRLITSAAFEAMKEEEPSLTESDASARIRDSLNGQKKKFGDPYGQTTNQRGERSDAWPGAIWKERFDAEVFPSQAEYEAVQQLAALYQETRQREPLTEFESIKRLARGSLGIQEKTPEPTAKPKSSRNLAALPMPLSIVAVLCFLFFLSLPAKPLPKSGSTLEVLEEVWLSATGPKRHQSYYFLADFPVIEASDITLVFRTQKKAIPTTDSPK